MKDVDVVVIGAGIHGAGVAQAAAAAGYSVLVLEKNGIASGTSSKSSKLIHGGLRYLESYQFSLVRKSLKERAVLCQVAPELVKLKPFYIPIYENTVRRPWQIRAGLAIYAFLGGLHKVNLFTSVGRNQLDNVDGLKKNKLQKVYRYYDGQTNDKKLTQAVMASAMQLGAELLCSIKIKSFIKRNDYFSVIYNLNNIEKEVKAKVIVNASGPWVNDVHGLVSTQTDSLDIDLVQGTHIFIEQAAPSGIYYLEAEDKRTVFVMPYEIDGEMKTMVGTTEKLFEGKADDVKPTEEEIEYLLKAYKAYFPEDNNTTIINNFAGLRVLPRETRESMFSRPRDTILHWAMPGLLTLYGGKLTAYRSTASSVIKKIEPLLNKKKRVAYTDQLYLS